MYLLRVKRLKVLFGEVFYLNMKFNKSEHVIIFRDFARFPVQNKLHSLYDSVHPDKCFNVLFGSFELYMSADIEHGSRLWQFAAEGL